MRIFIVAILSLLISSCAQIVPLSGGPEDRTAPKVETETPANGSLQFKSEVIVIKFDEYIQLKDLFNQLIITPQLKNQPDITASGKTLTIKFDEPLKENTTYRLFFGNAITDIYEATPIPNYEYTFSTGDHIDTLILNGILKDAYTGAPVKDAWAMLYTDTRDSIIYTNKPDYLARSDEKGQFRIRGLKEGSYKLIALVDKNKNYLYDNGELLGFEASPVTVPNNDTITLKLFTERSDKVFIKKTEHPNPEKVLVLFNAPLQKINSVSAATPEGVAIDSYIYKTSLLKDSILFNFTAPETEDAYEDSIYIKVLYNDTLRDSSLVTFLSKKQLEDQFSRKRLPLEIDPVLRSGSILPYSTSAYKLYSSFNIKQADRGQLVLEENGKPADSSKIKITQASPDSIYLSYKWKEESEYTLYLLKGFATDYYGRGSDSLRFTFKTNSKSDYGSLKVNLSGPDQGNYLLQLLNPGGRVAYERSFRVSDNGVQEIIFSDVLPDTYRLRVVSDTNGDKAFTPGVYLRKKQAEDVFISDQTIKVIGDWDNELKWEIKKQ
jgi:hypothetical protein